MTLVLNSQNVVEYLTEQSNQFSIRLIDCICECCGNLQAGQWPQDMIPGQDLGTSFQAFLGRANNYVHMPYEKQQEMLW